MGNTQHRHDISDDVWGPNTRIPLAVDANGMPVRVLVTAGTTADYKQAVALTDGFTADYLFIGRSGLRHKRD